ncbi:uncharacterized protein LOC120344839 [Styela clava]
MKNYILFLTLISVFTVSTSACPSQCSCFGWVGERIADCARRSLTEVTFSDFDADTTEIHLQYNKIETLDPATFANVPNLKHLYLQSNKISALPDGIFDNLPNLQTLRLNGNRIADIGANKFANLKKLILLYIHDNDIKTVDASAFNGLDYMEQVSVAGNPNLKDINVDAFAGNTNLTMIDMSGSALTGINPRLVNRNDKLEKVYTYDINTLICDSSLQVYLTWMNTHPRIGFGRATMVCAEPENLRGRSVLSIDPERHYTDETTCPFGCDCIKSMNTTIVDCSSRQLNAVPVGFPPSTTEIFLQGNNISSLRNYDFLHLTKLEYLYLHNNSIDFWDIFAFTGPEQTLKQLTLHDNLFDNIPTGIFRGMRNLEVFNMNDNQVSVILPNAFSDMVSVIQFSMNYNSIRIISSDTFANCLSLKYVGLAYNKLSNMSEDVFRNSPDIYYIDLSGNELDYLPIIPPGVTLFDARESRLKALRASSFQNAKNLEILNVTDNYIYIIEDEAFAGAPKLRQLHLGSNNMEIIDDKTFSSAPILQYIDLSYNSRLMSLSENAFFTQRKTLRGLYLNNGGLKTMSGKTLSIVENPGFYARLSDNPWNCDCKLQNLADYINTYPDTVDSPTCAEPKEEIGKEISQVTFVEGCAIATPQDEHRALIISLSIVGAVLIFVVVLGVILYKSRKDTKEAMMSAGMTNGGHESNGKEEIAYKNVAYDNADENPSGSAL